MTDLRIIDYDKLLASVEILKINELITEQEITVIDVILKKCLVGVYLRK